MTISELITVSAILVGPIVAVVITLWYQNFAEQRRSKRETFRDLWDSHHDAARPKFGSAIRRVPIDFRKHSQVVEAWVAYMAQVNSKPIPGSEDKYGQDFMDRKFDLISAMASVVEVTLTDRQIRDSTYHPESLKRRFELQTAALEAQPRIAASLEENTRLLRTSLNRRDDEN